MEKEKMKEYVLSSYVLIKKKIEKQENREKQFWSENEKLMN